MTKPTHHITADGTKISIKDLCIEWEAEFIFMPGHKEVGSVRYGVPKEWNGSKNISDNTNNT